MFACCGCPNKKNDRTLSEDEEEVKEKSPVPENVVKPNVEPAPTESVQSSVEVKNVVPVEKYTKIEEEDECQSTPGDGEVENVDPVPPDTELRKSSMKKPKPRLSISTEVKIIPSVLNVEDADEEAQSPLSDEVFAGEGSDPPRANLGVGVIGAGPQAVEFPRSPVLDVPTTPRGKAPTPHPKRASMPAVLPRWLSEEDDEGGGSLEPPVTPVAKDELALRRHRFFSDLLAAAQAAAENRVRFDPFGPEYSKEPDNANKELEALLDRLEKITARLEKAVPLLETTLEPLSRSIVVTKSLEDLLDEHLTPTEKEKINGLISDKIISPDSSADVADLSDRDQVPELLYDEPPEPEHFFKPSKKSELVCDPEDSLPDLPEDIQSDIIINESEVETFVESKGPCDSQLNGDIVIGEQESSDSGDRVTCGDCDLSDTEGSSDSPDTVVGDSSPNRRASPETSPTQLDMTNSQSTLSMSVQGFQSIVQGPLASYIVLSTQIGGDVAEHAKLVQGAFQAQLQYISQATQSRKPSPAEEQQLLLPTSQFIQAIQEFREKHRTSPLFNHLSAISESIPALGWVAVSPAPSPFVKEMNDAGQFYTNRVLKDWKEKDKKHVEWTKAWVSTLSELQGYVKQYHTTGLVWSGTGAVKGGAPPPPPSGPMPPPPPPLDLSLGELDLGNNDRSALFAEINRGSDVTKGLKKVTSDMQTHKNPAIRTGPAPFKVQAPTSNSSSRVAAAPVDKPPVFTRDGKKWLIEYQKGNNGLVVEGAEMNNVVYVFKCSESTITVKGKINSIFLDSCKKTAVVFDSVVSSVEFVNCQSVQMQVLGNVPTISIDKTDGCQMYLNDASLAVEIVSSKSSEMNVLVPKGNGDFTEFPIPEQFRTTVSKKGLNTTAVESTG